ncbi:MAG: glycosyltransferase family 4 protein [Eudoraea sp.]|nr:glycosyltransferase family 4 protein [Eudoraea sp.]
MKNKNYKRSLAIDVRMINSSGIGVYLKNILPHLVDKFHLTLLGDKEVMKSFKWANELNIIPFNAKVYSLKEQILYPFVVPRTDLYWCPHFNAPLLPIRTKKLLTTIYDVNHLANRQNSSFLKWRYAKLLYSNAVRKSIQIITISKFSKSEIVHYTSADPSKIEMIYCGVNHNFFSEQKELKINKIPEKYILYVGNIKPHKNLITLLKAYAQLPPSMKDEYQLLILGKKDGFITPDLEIFGFIEENKLQNNIHFTGYVEDDVVPAIYQKAALFVFPSLYEGFGLPPLEAMASGVPVLCSDVTSLPEVGGEAVVYFSPNNTNELGIKMEELLRNSTKREILIKKGLQQAKLFSWDDAGEYHLQLINQILEN